MVKNPPANAGDKGSIPGPGRFLMLEQLSLWATTSKPVFQSPWNKRSHRNEKPAYCIDE